ncbi:hypothetical protein Z517_09252 [Fonsecaea pedrosoi CBS 271.37]|uniref:Uncharacterized protein n=1 Tax=Fonsecaea pedrosoi CBS 271.37 TaxID=1442368 RepID=A0A0D2G7Z3_9EURO|nr:uncharacterized protein Z517_09252 [Fonsecaea pedrosoi CBS 271.37]KIW76808.1 hypothetical protein Z517_09252 [Fonsecaea pedrosoi CBS 271.37]
MTSLQSGGSRNGGFFTWWPSPDNDESETLYLELIFVRSLISTHSRFAHILASSFDAMSTTPLNLSGGIKLCGLVDPDDREDIVATTPTKKKRRLPIFATETTDISNPFTIEGETIVRSTDVNFHVRRHWIHRSRIRRGE